MFRASSSSCSNRESFVSPVATSVGPMAPTIVRCSHSTTVTNGNM